MFDNNIYDVGIYVQSNENTTYGIYNIRATHAVDDIGLMDKVKLNSP